MWNDKIAKEKKKFNNLDAVTRKGTRMKWKYEPVESL